MKKLLLVSLWAFFWMGFEAQAATPLQDDVYAAQSSSAEESTVNEVRWYQVELLVFKQQALSTEIAEQWPKDIILSYPDNWETLKTPEEYQFLYQKKTLVNTPFIFLDKKYFQLTAIEKKLQINRNDILFHGAWRQSLTQNLDQKSDANVISILVRGGNAFDDHTELEGSISLSLQRYLHVNTNLWLTKFISAVALPAPAVNTEIKTDVTESLASIVNWPELPMFPMKNLITTDTTKVADTNPIAEKKYQVDEIYLNKQSRRMRSYETHYIDHPKFGILVRMIPLDTNTLQPIPQTK